MDEKFRNVGLVDYDKGSAPKDYKCDKCEIHGVRLWRECTIMASLTELLCADCAEKDQAKNYELGWKSSFSMGHGDQIGWLVPAVPLEGRDTYWAYTSVPERGIRWWQSLPVKK